MRTLRKSWLIVTATQTTDNSLAQLEYLTKVLLVIMSTPLSIATLSIITGWILGAFETSAVLIILSIDLPVALAIWGAYHNQILLASYIPPVLCSGLAFYFTYNYSLFSSGLLFSMIAILLSAMLQGIKTQWLVAVFSVIGHLVIGILRYPYSAADFVAFGITIGSSYGGTALLLGFYIHQLKRAFAKAGASEEKIRNLFERVPIGLYRTTPDGRILDANPALIEMLKAPDLESLLGVNTSALYMNPIDRLREKALLERKGTVYGFQLELRDFEGNPIWVRDTVRAIQDQKGNVLYYEGSLEDITERQLAEQQLKISEARYRAIVEDQTELICRFLPDSKLTFVNEAYCRYFGRERNQLLGESLVPMFFAEDRPLLTARLATARPEKPTVIFENRVVKEEGDIRWQQWINRAIYDRSENLVEFQSVGRDITEQKQAEERLNYLATHDLLTDLPNRVLLYDRLNNALERARRNRANQDGKHMVAVMMLDLDNFKQINDTQGHAKGDEILKAIANRLKDSIRMSDTVARLGGDEFILVIEAIASSRYSAQVAQKILSAVAEPLWLDDHTYSLSASMGISLYPIDGEDVETLLKNADAAMYRAKEGRNDFRFYRDDTFLANTPL